MPVKGTVISVSYAAWREHHKTCWHCSRYDWYEPGRPAMRLKPPVTAADRILWPFQRLMPDGKTPVWFAERADSSVLCGTGRYLFNVWTRHAVGQPYSDADDATLDMTP